MLVVYKEGDEEPEDLLNDGLTPPTTSIREKRFRKKKFTVIFVLQREGFLMILFQKEEISDVEKKLLAIMEGKPQVTYGKFIAQTFQC